MKTSWGTFVLTLKDFEKIFERVILVLKKFEKISSGSLVSFFKEEEIILGPLVSLMSFFIERERIFEISGISFAKDFEKI